MSEPRPFLDPDNPTMLEAFRELREAIADLTLVSHISGTDPGQAKTPRDASESIGGGKPSGTDREFKPKPPKASASEAAWDAYDEELEAWLACYHRKTPDWFRRQIPSHRSTAKQLVALAKEAREVTAAWRRAPQPSKEPEFGSPQWKRYIAESKESADALAKRFFCTPRYINKVRQYEWSTRPKLPNRTAEDAGKG